MSKRAIRESLVRDVLGDGEEQDAPDAPVPADEPEIPAINAGILDPAPVAVAAPSAPITLTAEMLQEMLLSVVKAAQSGNAGIAEALQESVARARQKIPENEMHSGASTLNPAGGPKPAVRMPVWHGMIDPQDQKVHPLVPIAGVNNLEQACSVTEIEALNTLRETGLVSYELTDGTVCKVRVVQQVDGAGEPWRLVICWPQGHFQNKELRNRIGRIPYMVKQLTADAVVAA